MNKVILIGNLAADPESRTTQSGVAQCTLRLAVQRRFANQQGVREADFFNVVCWRQTAEFCSRYLSKGRKIAVEGSLQTRSYDAQDGSKRYVTEVVVNEADFVENKSASDEKTAEGGSYAYNPYIAAATAEEFEEVSDDQLPF